jgi:hypothetical protein
VLSTGPGGFKVEVSFEDTGKILGHDFSQFATYTADSRPDGSLYAEGNGVMLLQNGDALTWRGTGVGVLKAGGAVGYRGAIFFTTSSPALARLNSVAGAFEFEVDAAGNTHSKVWEWK